MSHYQRVSKQMVQMFGPQWIEKFGKTNDAWDAALKDFTYSQVSAGIAKVMRGELKFPLIDLPNFLELCKPPPMPKRPEQMERPKEWEGLSEAEIRMHCQANVKMIVWACKHPVYGVDAVVQNQKKLTDEQKRKIWQAGHRIAHDYFMMREELGKDEVPDEDFFKALYRAWDRIAEEE